MLKLSDISIKLGEFRLENINLELDKGDYYVLLGKSGVGKTVLLEIIAGLIKPNSGKVFFNNKDITHTKIQNRKIGIVFQDYSVFPHLTVKQNIAYPLKGKKISNTKKEELINQYAQIANISHLLNRGTKNLSGGELQRVALARMLVSNPDCILLDEPLASLDVQLKGGLRNLLRKINRDGVTILHVTHDYEEAIALSNKVAVIHDGKIIQKGFTKDVFKKPANEFVANFTGIKNFFIADSINDNIAQINHSLKIKVSNPEKLNKGKIIIRGEEIIISNKQIESSATNNFKGEIKQIIPYLTNQEIMVDVGVELSVVISEESLLKFDFSEGDIVWISFKSSAIKILP
ncbi:MAG: ATP-binding cassette domain-containing protein [Bacteroidales bacterium]|nr:ATP-binding cassette domain-containing protein [Bacteroidales bacterium]